MRPTPGPFARLSALACATSLGVGGCLANFERNLDLVFGANAFENALALPYAGLGRAALWLAGLL